MEEKSDKNIVIIGAGPAGLSCAYYLLKHTNIKPVILEESQYIGGISRTHVHNGNRMDLGGHRFFTKSKEVMDLWLELFPVNASKEEKAKGLDITTDNVLNDESADNVFLVRNRVSRIYFLKKFFDYPISFKLKTFLNLGLINVIKAGFGYLYSCIKKRKENSLEDFYINRFGCPLYKMFFEDYTNKVWGKHPSEIAPDWGSQRVKGLSLIEVLKNCILKPFMPQRKVETSLIEKFIYPKKGPGQLYEAMADEIRKMGGKIIMNNSVYSIAFSGDKITAVKTKDDKGNEFTYDCDILFSSMPVKDLICAFEKPPEDKVLNIAKHLPYRDFITVGLLVKELAVKNKPKNGTVSELIPDCWIYIQERNVKLGRLQIFNNWSPYMLNNPEKEVFLGLEYFCSEGDSLWNMSETDFINMAANELESIGIIKKENIIDSTLIKVKKAYPAYFGVYKDFDTVRNYLDSIENLYCIGRNGQHRYNNMDHSILTGIEAVKAFIKGSDKKNVWNVNTECDYHEKK